MKGVRILFNIAILFTQYHKSALMCNMRVMLPSIIGISQELDKEDG